MNSATPDEYPTLPDPHTQWMLQTPAAPPTLVAPTQPASRRRSRWPWIVALVVVAALAACAWVVGEYIARGIVERTIREQLIENLNLPADQQIDVDVPGAILPQLIAGSLGQVTVSSDDVPLGGADSGAALAADVRIVVDDVPIRGGVDWSSATGTITIDEAQLNTLLGTIDGFPIDTVTLDPPDVGISMELQLWALTVPVGVDLTPTVDNGELVLTPQTLRVAGAEVEASALVDQFGAIATTVIRDWHVCIAQYYPAGVTLTGVEVTRDGLTATVEIDSAILRDAAAQATGTCS
ncbi:LmeA family phospholipid-binding protein [Microbacterium sp.]|uniref:LmeA family phospholipid-binding protein n=1 Tax=Microbacterium sp. TaxID=51671 RepID=UPI0039E619EC